MLVLEVSGLEEIVTRWREAGVSLVPAEWADPETGIAGCPFGRFIGFRDPDGNYLEILELYTG